MKKIIPFIALVTSMVLWSSTFVALKFSFRHFPPMFVIFARMWVAAIAFLPLMPFIKPDRIKKKDLLMMLALAVFEPCFYFVFEAMALAKTSSSQAGMITALLPLLVALAAAVFLKEKTSRKTYAGFILAMTGAILLSALGTPEAESPNPLLGNFYEFMAMCCATGYTILLKKLSKDYNPFFLTSVQTFCGAVFFAIILFAKGIHIPSQWPLIPSLTLVYLGIFITMGAYGLYNFGISKVPASQASVFINLIPIFSVFWGWGLLNERFTISQTFAGALILIGVWISQDRAKNKELQTKTCVETE